MHDSWSQQCPNSNISLDHELAIAVILDDIWPVGHKRNNLTTSVQRHSWKERNLTIATLRDQHQRVDMESFDQHVAHRVGRRSLFTH